MSPADLLLLSVERLRIAVQAQHWQASVEACDRLCAVIAQIAERSAPASVREAALQAQIQLREIQQAVGREMLRMPQEIARLENYRTGLSAYAHHDLPLDDAP